MRVLFILILSLVFPLCAENIEINRSARSFEMVQPKKERVDVFDFSGEFEQLEEIDIDARKRKNVEFYLTGDYPLLESVHYTGSFGIFSGELTGNFPKLSLINFLCTSCAMNFDLCAEWQSSCEINIVGKDENIIVKLPNEVGLVVYTKTSLKGKVVVSEELKRQGRYSLRQKKFQNAIAETAPVVLTINIETNDGHIILN
jgi:hypothetical protein